MCVCVREKVCYLRFRDTMSRQLHNCKIAFSQRALNIIKSHTYRSPLRRLLVLGGHDHSFLVNYWMKRCVDDLATFTCSYKAIQVAGMILFLILKLKRKWGILVPRAPAHVFVSRWGLYMTEMRAHSALMLGMRNDVLALDMHWRQCWRDFIKGRISQSGFNVRD